MHTVIPILEHIIVKKKEIKNQERTVTSWLFSAEKKEQELTRIESECVQEQQAIDHHKRRMNTLFEKIASFFSSAHKQELFDKLQELEADLSKSKEAFIRAEQEYRAILQQVHIEENTKAKLRAEIDEEIHALTVKHGQTVTFETVEASLAAKKRKIAEQQKNLSNDAQESGYDNTQLAKMIDELQKKIDRLQGQSTSQRIQNALIVAATVDTFLKIITPEECKEHPFFHIFLDEAGYCSLIKGMILFGYSCPVTMLGDHMQLPPVCEATEREFSDEGNPGIFLYAQSALFVEEIIRNEQNELLQQFLHNEEPHFDLLHKSNLFETYRFGSELSKTLNDYVYKNGFHSSNNTSSFKISVIHAEHFAKLPRTSIPEAKAIAELCSHINVDDYIILTPYRNQVSLISEVAPVLKRDQKILTIHRSQGREWDTVILSVVDAYSSFFMDSNKNIKVINTAVSRAKKWLIIVCDTYCWQKKQGQLISELVSQGLQYHGTLDCCIREDDP